MFHVSLAHVYLLQDTCKPPRATLTNPVTRGHNQCPTSAHFVSSPAILFCRDKNITPHNIKWRFPQCKIWAKNTKWLNKMVRPRIFFYNLHCYDKHNRCPLSTIAAQLYPFRPWAMVSVRSVMLAVLTMLCSITWVWTLVSGLHPQDWNIKTWTMIAPLTSSPSCTLSQTVRSITARVECLS